jgi:uncharacterized protein YjdB
MLSRFRLLVLCVALSACTGKDATAPMSVASVLVSVPSHTFYVGASVQATVAVTDQSGNAISGQAVSWSTSDPTIATVSQSGLMTGTGAGFATITASVGTHQGTAALTVTLVPVASVLVTPATSALLVGQTQQLTAAAHDSAGNILSNRTITWSTSDSTKARVSSTGLVTAVAAGSVSITATIGTQLGLANFQVSLVPVASVAITPTTNTLFVGQTQQLTAVALDSAGNALANRTITWSTSDGTKISVSNTGLVTAIGAGSVTVTATIGGKSATSIASAGLPTIQAAMDSTPVAQVGTLYFPTLRVRVMFGGKALSGYNIQWTTKDSTNGWAFAVSPFTDSAGYVSANWISGPAASQQVSVQGNGVTLVLPFQAVAFVTGTNGRGTNWTDATGSQADGFRVSLTAATAPLATYYAAMQWNSGYAGIQTQGDGTRNLIFTIWDFQGVTASLIYQDSSAVPVQSGTPVCGRGVENGGNFLHCLEVYPWKVNHTYGFELDMTLGNGYSDYTIFVTDSSTGTRLKFATIRGVPHTGAYPLGSGGFSTWTEDFGTQGSSCFTTDVHDLTATSPSKLVGGVWQPMTGAVHGSTEYTGGCQNVSLTKSGNGVRMTGGGYRVDPPMAPNTSYTIPIP